MTENPKDYLFGSLDQAYREERRKFETENATAQLVADIVQIIEASTQEIGDNIRVKPGTYIERESVTITAAVFEFEDLMDIGETAVTKNTDWLPCGQREIEGSKVNFLVKFQQIEFVRLQGEQPQSRLGPIIIEGQVLDNDGVRADFPLARLFPDRETGEYKLLYSFGNEVPFNSEDYQAVEKIVQDIKAAA